MKYVNDKLKIAQTIIPSEMLPNKDCLELTGAPEWYGFEYDLWHIGEEIRQYVKSNSTKYTEEQLHKIVEIINNPNAKRGRQSFISLLGYKRYQHLADNIISQISDKNVEGQIISTVMKMQAPQFLNIIRPYINHDIAWIRNIAKEYMKKYDNA